MKKITKHLKAFTLAEVLITLGIIGVVAAMTIPTLISKIGKRQLETQINTAGCWHKKGTVKDLQGNPSPWDYDAGLGSYIVTFVIAKGAYFNIDGMSIYRMNTLFGINTDSIGLVFYFDANGDKKPNRMGKDIFIMVWNEEGLVPAGHNKTQAEVNTNCLRGDGYFCLQMIASNSWTIPDSLWKRK